MHWLCYLGSLVKNILQDCFAVRGGLRSGMIDTVALQYSAHNISRLTRIRMMQIRMLLLIVDLCGEKVWSELVFFCQGILCFALDMYLFFWEPKEGCSNRNRSHAGDWACVQTYDQPEWWPRMHKSNNGASVGQVKRVNRHFVHVPRRASVATFQFFLSTLQWHSIVLAADWMVMPIARIHNNPPHSILSSFHKWWIKGLNWRWSWEQSAPNMFLYQPNLHQFGTFGPENRTIC